MTLSTGWSRRAIRRKRNYIAAFLQAFLQAAFLGAAFFAAFFTAAFLAGAALAAFFTAAFLGAAFFATFFGIDPSPERGISERNDLFRSTKREWGESVHGERTQPSNNVIPSKRTEDVTAKFILQRKRFFLIKEKHVLLKSRQFRRVPSTFRNGLGLKRHSFRECPFVDDTASSGLRPVDNDMSKSSHDLLPSNRIIDCRPQSSLSTPS